MSAIYTIGHSTRSIEDFIGLLRAHAIATLVDIRSFPGSRRYPHFNREALDESLAKENIRYVWMKDLGGRRGKQVEHSPNVALRNPSFRNYADYMLTPEFKDGIQQLLEVASASRTAIMCSEAVYFRCHRMLVSDYLLLHGHDVCHIQNLKLARPHRVTPEARLVSDDVIYKADHLR